MSWPSRILFLSVVLLCGCRAEAPDQVAAPSDPSPAVASARAQLEAGQYDAAAQAAWVLVQEHPGRLDARLVLSSANVLQGRHVEALEHADAALRLDAASADAMTNRGAALHGLGRADEALRATEAALTQEPEHQGALRNAARLHGEAKRWLAERAALETLARLRVADAEVRLLLARNRANAGDLPEALHAINAAVERAPDNPALHTFAATLNYELDRLESAMDHADIALRVDAGRADARLVFEAAFYVRVASRLRCLHGPAPWADEAVAAELGRLARQGVGGVERFRALHARQGADEGVLERVAQPVPISPSGSASSSLAPPPFFVA